MKETSFTLLVPLELAASTKTALTLLSNSMREERRGIQDLASRSSPTALHWRFVGVVERKLCFHVSTTGQPLEEALKELYGGRSDCSLQEREPDVPARRRTEM